MTKRVIVLFAILWLYPPLAANAANSDDLAEIRQQIDQLKRSYETRIRALEQRLQEAEARVEENQVRIEQESPRAAVEPVPQQVHNNAFNPALSFILQGSVNSYSQDPDSYALPGFQLGEEAGLAAEGLTLDETEITASASVDQLFYAETTLSLSDDSSGTEIEIEEAYVDPTALPAGFGGRFGRFYSGIGYLNQKHTHAWDFHDAPLVYRAFLGTQYGDDGVRLTWTAPTDLYLMLGGETLAGNNFPGGESQSVKGDVQTLFAKLGGDVSSSWAWQAGVSALLADANDRAGNDDTTWFNGDSDLYGVDMVWKWAPNGNPQQRNLILQGEFFYRDESGKVNVTDGINNGLLSYNGDQTGWYAQAIYQFMPQWRFGARYDRLTSDNNLDVINLGGFTDAGALEQASGLADNSHDPHRWSAMFDWSPSEFSRLRAQYDRDNSRRKGTDNQWSLQYIMSIGSHGAHLF